MRKVFCTAALKKRRKVQGTHCQLLPTHGCYLLNSPPSLSPSLSPSLPVSPPPCLPAQSFREEHEQRRTAGHSVCSVCVCRCVHVRCVVLGGERASVQLSGSDPGLTVPLSVHMKPHRPRLCLCGHATGRPACVCVSGRVHVSHVCPQWSGGRRGSKLLCGALAGWMLAPDPRGLTA